MFNGEDIQDLLQNNSYTIGHRSLTDNEPSWIAWAILPKFGATTSIISSIFLVRDVMIKRHKENNKSISLTNAILFGISVNDIFGAFFSFFMSTWMVPRGQAPYAAGNQVTCNMQGFFVTWHFIYFVTAYTALALLYWLIVKWNLSEEIMSRWRIRIVFGLPPIIISLGFSLAPLFLEMYNIGRIHCTIMPFPASCFFNDTECTRGGNARALQLTKNGYALICGLAIIVFMSLLVYAVYSQEKKGDRYAVSSQDVTRTYTRKAAWRGILFSGAFFLAYIWYYIFLILNSVDTPRHVQVFNVIFYFYTVLTPCMGFYNAVVYFQPRYSAHRVDGNNKMESLCHVLNINDPCRKKNTDDKDEFELEEGLVAQSSTAFSSIRNDITGSRLNTDTKLKLKSSTTLNDVPTQYTRVANTQLKSTTLNDIPTQASTRQQPIEKVAIIGAGIAGLSLAHALRSTNLMKNDNVNDKPIQIDIFDSRKDLDEKSGSGIQLTGGIAALRKISPKLQRQVSDASIPLQKVVSTCRPWFGSNTNDSWKIFELDLQRAIKERDAADKEKIAKEVAEESGCIENKQIDGLVAEDGEILAYTILRGTLQRMMQIELSKEHSIDIQFDKRLCDISNKEGEGITCQFTDGTQTSGYDLIIGCDGIQSAVRQYVNNGSIQAKEKEAAIYSGLRITFAIQEDAQDADEVCTFTQNFGNGAYALTSTYGAGKDKSRAKGAFLVYPDENYIGPFKRQKPVEEDTTGTSKTTSIDEAKPLDENVDWTQNNRIPKDKIQECLKILQTSSISGNDVASIVEKSDRFFDLGVYFYNPFTFNGWIREIKGSDRDNNPKFAVLAGDAAHAMPPFLGQGANQAMQDSCSLAAKIFEYNSQVSTSSSEPDLKALLKEYENRRWLPITSITVKAALLGYLEVGPSLISNFRDVFFLVMGKIGVAKKVFLDSAFPKM